MLAKVQTLNADIKSLKKDIKNRPADSGSDDERPSRLKDLQGTVVRAYARLRKLGHNAGELRHKNAEGKKDAQ